MEITQELAGRFRLETSGGERGYIDHGWSDNLILDTGIQKLLTSTAFSNNVCGYMSVGTASNPVNTSQTSLLGRLATTSRAQKESFGYNEAERFGWTRMSVQFDKGAAAGNISELGAGWDSIGSLFSRAIILDSSGLPTAITVLPDEFLTVTYELRRWWNGFQPTVISYFDEGVERVATVESVDATDTSGRGLGAAPTNAFIKFEQSSSITYEKAESGALLFSINFELTEGNPSIGTVTSSQSPLFTANIIPYSAGFKFTPPIPKTNEFTVTIKCQVTFKRRGE